LSAVLPAVVTIVALVFLGTWISVRGIGVGQISMLPSHARHRAAWMFGHARVIEAACVLVAMGALGMRLAA
jgi:hypothetical protein